MRPEVFRLEERRVGEECRYRWGSAVQLRSLPLYVNRAANPRRNQDGWRPDQGLVQGGHDAIPAARDIEPQEDGLRLPDRPMAAARAETDGLRDAIGAGGTRSRSNTPRLCASLARRALRRPVQPPHSALGPVDAGAVVPNVDR